MFYSLRFILAMIFPGYSDEGLTDLELVQFLSITPIDLGKERY